MSPMPAGMDWNDQTITALRSLWDEGHSTAEIGRRIGTTKNAVVGKAHRLCLPTRPSPIRSTPQRHETPATRSRPPAPPLARVEPAPKPVPAPPPAVLPTTPPAAAPIPQPSPARYSSPNPSQRNCDCQWPMGDPGRTGFRLCGEVSVAGKPYCIGHCNRAYIRPQDSLAAAAMACTSAGKEA